MSLKILALHDALKAGIAKAEQMGIAVGIVTVDSAGFLVAAARMDTALPLSPEIAYGKASASALMRLPSADLQKRWQPGAPVPATLFARTGGRFTPQQGALPISQNGEVVGAVGVSGASSADDEQVAQAVVDAYLKSI